MNTPPFFSTILKEKIEIIKETTQIFSLPVIVDSEGLKVSVKSYEKNKDNIPLFVYYDDKNQEFEISPAKNTKSGNY